MKRPLVLNGVAFYKSSTLNLVSVKKNTIATNIFCATNMWELSTGLMFRELKEKQAMIFLFKKTQKVINIHMFCVFHPIDILFCKVLSSAPLRFEIKDIKQNLLPFGKYSSDIAPCDAFIELPVGASDSLALGDVISLQ